VTAKFSLKEAAVIADVPESAVRKSIEGKRIHPEKQIVGRVTRYRFNARDLLYLKAMREFPLALRHDDWLAWQEIIESKCASSGRWYVDDSEVVTRSGEIVVRVELQDLIKTLTKRLRSFLRGRRRIVSDPDILGGEPVFAGTRIPLSHIVGLFAKKVSIEEIKEDYPSLSFSDLEYAAMIARMKPNSGRPRKSLTLIRDGRSVATIDRALSVGEAPSR